MSVETNETKKGLGIHARRALAYIVLVIMSFLCLFWFYILFVNATRSKGELTQGFTLLPSTHLIQNWKGVMARTLPVVRGMINSLVVATCSAVLCTYFSTMTAYAIHVYDFKLKKFAWAFIMAVMMIPGQITYISVYLMMSKAKLINSLWPQILPLGANAFGIFMLRQGFKQIPDEIIESARLDNASEAQIMTRICLPMCKSSMITIAMFSFIGTWNAYFWPLVMTNSDKFRPLTLYIEKLKQEVEQGIMWNEIMAGNFILVVPVIIVFIFASKKIIQAFAYNGMK